jgi:hypothetical protein
MATNDYLVQKTNHAYVLQQYQGIHDHNCALHPDVLVYLENVKDMLEQPITININGCGNTRTITMLDYIINILGGIVVNTQDKPCKRMVIEMPLFNPNAMLENCYWSYPIDPINIEIELVMEYGLCQNIFDNIKRNWDKNPTSNTAYLGNFNLFVCSLIGYMSKSWGLWSGNLQYPVPEFRDRCRVDDDARAANAHSKYYLTKMSDHSQYAGEYGSIRLDLALFVLNQLIVFRIFKA